MSHMCWVSYRSDLTDIHADGRTDKVICRVCRAPKCKLTFYRSTIAGRSPSHFEFWPLLSCLSGPAELVVEAVGRSHQYPGWPPRLNLTCPLQLTYTTLPLLLQTYTTLPLQLTYTTLPLQLTYTNLQLQLKYTTLRPQLTITLPFHNLVLQPILYTLSTWLINQHIL